MRGLRLLFLCALMFGLVIYAAKMELRSAQRLGLLNTYTTIFSLNPDDLAAIKTPDAFFDYLKLLSEQSRLLQVNVFFKHLQIQFFFCDYLKQRSVQGRLLQVQIVKSLL